MKHLEEAERTRTARSLLIWTLPTAIFLSSCSLIGLPLPGLKDASTLMKKGGDLPAMELKTPSLTGSSPETSGSTK